MVRWLCLVILGAGCGPPPVCEHGVGADGRCCPAWTRGDGQSCRERGWSTAAASGGLGEQASYPSVAVDEGGRAWIAWQQGYFNGSALVLAREAAPGEWAISSPSAGQSGLHYEARIAMVRDGVGAIAWERMTSVAHTEVRVAVAGGAFALPPKGGQFSFAPYGHQHQVLVGGDGEHIVTWNQGLDEGARRGICVAVRPPGEHEFVRPTSQADVLSQSVQFTNEPKIARNDRGDVVIGWFESVKKGGKLLPFASERWGEGGHFSHPRPDDALAAPDGDVDRPEPAIAEDGRAAMIWRQVRHGDHLALYLAERSASGQWARPASIEDALHAPEDVSPKAVELANRAQHLRLTRSGDLYAVWDQKVSGDWSVMAVHRDARGRWIAPGAAPLRLSGTGHAREPLLAVGGDGSVVAVWLEEVAGRFRLMTRHTSVDAPGATEVERWSEAKALSPGLGDAASPALAIGQTGRVVAAWAEIGRIFVATID